MFSKLFHLMKLIYKMDYFSGKNVAITGALGGIGTEICKEFLNQGVKNLAMIDLRDESGKTAKLQLEFPNSKVIFKVVDVMYRDQIEKILFEIKQEFKQLHILVNSAGILCDQQIETTIGINTLGTIYSSLAAMHLMSKKEGGVGGVIVNLASIIGVKPNFIMPVYTGSKFAVVGFTRAMADDHYYNKTGVKFMIICPDKTSTEMVENIKDRVLLLEDGLEIQEKVDSVPAQSPKNVSECVIQAIKSDKNGSMWYPVKGEIVEITNDDKYLIN